MTNMFITSSWWQAMCKYKVHFIIKLQTFYCLLFWQNMCNFLTQSYYYVEFVLYDHTSCKKFLPTLLLIDTPTGPWTLPLHLWLGSCSHCVLLSFDNLICLSMQFYLLSVCNQASYCRWLSLCFPLKPFSRVQLLSRLRQVHKHTIVSVYVTVWRLVSLVDWLFLSNAENAVWLKSLA